MSANWTLLRSLAAYGLTDAIKCFPLEPLEGPRWRALHRQAGHQRLATALIDAARRGDLAVTDEQLDEAIELGMTAAAHVLGAERTLLQAAAALTAAGIEHRVLKGSAHAHLLYPDPSVRAFGDTDLLVRGSAFGGAVTTLVGLGAVRPVPELRTGFDARFGKGATLKMPDGHEIDLHRTFVAGPLGMSIDADALFDTGEAFALGGSTLFALGREERLLHTCVHAILGNVSPRLTALRDVAQAALDPALDTARVQTLARTWGASAVVAKAVATTWEAFELQAQTDLTRWAGHYAPSDRERATMDAYGATSGRWAHQALAAVRSIPGLRSKVAYVHAIVLPDRQALNARDRSRLSFWSRGLRALGHHE